MKKPKKAEIKPPITAEMNIQQVIEKYPRISEVLVDYGLHCVGCAISQYESIEQGARAHGIDDESMRNLMDEINLVISKKADYPLNQKGVTLSPRAIEMIKSLIKENKERAQGLQIKASKGEDGLQYFLDLTSGPEQEEQTIEQDGVRICIDELSLRLVKPSVIDFLKTPMGEGFKVIKLD